MTDREIDVQVAEALGWRWFQKLHPTHSFRSHRFIVPPGWDALSEYTSDGVERLQIKPCDKSLPTFSDALRDVPRYSTDVAAAMGALATFPQWSINRLKKTHLVAIGDKAMADPSLPLAICRCILAAKGVVA